MSIIKRNVLLLKAQKSDDINDEYEVMLKGHNYIVNQVKTLDFNYVNLENLKDKLSKPSDYSGLIFSSPRCVNAVKLALTDGESLHEDWKLNDNYVVGEATYRTALQELKLNCLGKDTGNANILSQEILKGGFTIKVKFYVTFKEFVIEKKKYLKPFLYPHGNLKMDILKSIFKGTNVCMDEILVYETIANTNIKTELEIVTNKFSELPEYIVFFSPSGVKAMEEVLRSLPVNSIKMIAIGPTTEHAMLTSDISVFGTAEKPSAQHLLNILLQSP